MHIAKYNVGPFSSEDKLLEMEEEFNHMKWDVLGLSEVRRKGGQLIKLKLTVL